MCIQPPFFMTAKRFTQRSGRAIGLVVAAILLFEASVWAEALTVTREISEYEQAAALTYWTRERIASAPPLPMPIDSEAKLLDVQGLEELEIDGPEGSTPAGAAEPGAIDVARAAYPEDWEALEQANLLEEPLFGQDEAEAVEGTSSVYTSYDVNTNSALWQIYPHRWAGRLTFRTPTGNSSCSATAISGNNIVTAAHCVYDSTGNVFFSNWVFAPAYRNGTTPYGTFAASACTVLTAWVNLTGSFSIGTWSRHDVAVCTMNNNSAGQTLNGATGSAGRLWNASSNQLAFINGYPAETYTGAAISNGATQYLRSCTAETFSYATDTLGGGCSWGRGASGGSWLVGYKPFVVTGKVNSVSSGLFLGQQNLYGARFNSNNIVVLCNTRGC